ncbi:protein phosphatase 1 regulatory subunit 26 isoform X3 [Triplophysa rosa]|uniref:Protein phosphatase 1 regulatory subunit 26 N-terminal domain-containing protein n=1 Tax=Triplophysa rosa TaxID=992332 RepID=A0A9W7TGR9_TRIRA|nr:protein phosphatase 1 regulatory subunit 26 isoform X2 [Triplophysa rosa]XP_057216546.1 protein phosphatase 1 regulatory subunit 26 isoform X2 [Triplophysa rosa]XP_057216547.1 protein phosphatase 1 regulatory subunit 26 isoform X2 [Triplophysa rosa]XP_057216549.1 protein phosphatase 1 regulatory subunit 26 isoform X3 [Triplophysa rosa]KAI7795787.1 putative protein phosphatase 1 regulatory subunit 26 [Triplophysa rosa]
MFLKTVPPAVAIHSEWRSSKSCILPLFFNDSASDSDLASVNGTPIPQKIQMIIESLHSTQSSDMTDNVQDAHSSHETGCKGQVRLADTAVRSCRTDARRQAAGSDTGEDSDSDDSVDRGIEEAIQEYLKEKVDHKRKGDSVTGSSPAAKLQRREPSAPDAAKQLAHSGSGKVLTASNHIQREPSTQPLKEKVKKKSLSKENPFKKADVSKSLPVKSPPLSRCKKGSSSSSEMDRSPPRLVIKEELLDSSSDDGIEEEIKRFQQEKKVKLECKKDTTRNPQRTDDSDTSSDEGIEEAIRRFQAEKCENKTSPLKPTQPVLVQRIAQPLKTLSKKNNTKKLTTKKSERPASLTISQFLNKCSSQGSKVKALAAQPTSPRTTDAEHQIPSGLNVDTADLMCAEAILDISKTVMPEVFESNFNRTTQQTFPATDDKSNDSSVDSEDGIEQEIRKFLELKAQLNKEPSPDPTAGKEPKKKAKETQSSKVRLSLSRKRKFKEQSKPSADGGAACDVNKEMPSGKTSVRSESTRSQISSSGISAPLTVKNNKPKQNSPARKVSDASVPQDKGSPNASLSLIGSERNDSSDKSSSLDSDEDLDAAIKDLLKTKKKVKKKVRDMRARKGLSEALTTDTLKKLKLTTEQKNAPHVKTVKSTLHAKSNKSPRSKAGKSKSEAQNCKQPTSLGNDGGVNEHHQESGLPPSIQQANEDDSCVDSDDSIEQEIRRFLAERAKVATPVLKNVKQEGGGDEDLATAADVKLEHQQIPIEPPAGLQNNETQTEMKCAGVSLFVNRQTDSPAEADKGPVLTPGSSCIKGFWKAENENLEISTSGDQKNGLSSKSISVSHISLKFSSFTSPSEMPQTSDQHQNLFLMASGDGRMNELTECPSTDCNERLTSHQSRPAPRIPLSEVIRSVCPSPFSKTEPPESSPSTENPAITTGDVSSSTPPGSRTEEIYVHDHMNRDKKDQSSPDQTAFPSFSAQKTNHLQVRQSQPSEYRLSLGEKQREGGEKQEEKEQEGRMKEDEEETCLDETDVEADEDREDQKMKAGRQHQPSQSLSTSIDPGILLSPYIALDTEERRLRFRSRRLQIQKQLQYSTTVKRRLQFVVSVPR